MLDPAMGSAHFLVGTTLYLARTFGEAHADWDDVPDEPALRRLVAERCCYGVDLNPVAVELARLSLWLATARTGEPLTFLPNLQAGNSLVGPRLADEIEHVPSDQAGARGRAAHADVGQHCCSTRAMCSRRCSTGG